MQKALPIFSFLLISIFIIPLAYACIHVPLTYEGIVTYDTEEILMYHDGKYAHMIIKPTIQVQGKDVPQTLGWIIPVQSLPVEYKEADAKVFDDLSNYVQLGNPPVDSMEEPTNSRGLESISYKGLIVHPKQFVGHYEIQPIELKTDSQGQELLAWFAADGFKTKNKDISYYLQHHYVYLAIKITGLEQTKEALRPLHIVYASDELSVPLKFDSLSGTFDVIIYFITKQKLLNTVFMSEGISLEASLDYPIDPALKSINYVQATYLEGRFAGMKLPYGTIYKFTGHGINSSNNPLKYWQQDPAIPIK